MPGSVGRTQVVLPAVGIVDELGELGAELVLEFIECIESRVGGGEHRCLAVRRRVEDREGDDDTEHDQCSHPPGPDGRKESAVLRSEGVGLVAGRGLIAVADGGQRGESLRFGFDGLGDGIQHTLSESGRGYLVIESTRVGSQIRLNAAHLGLYLGRGSHEGLFELDGIRSREEAEGVQSGQFNQFVHRDVCS